MITRSPPHARLALQTQRFLASRKVQIDETPHPAMLTLARQSRSASRGNRRLAEFLRIERGIET